MATLDARYKINGLIDTSRAVFENLETITNSCATWLSYDGLTGQWSVIINKASSPVAAFDDSNIIGGITLTTTALDAYYNECEVRFHNIDLRDKEDYVLLSIPVAQRFPNEPVNRLIINAPMVNNQIQAQLIGLIELKQSRLDKIVEFVTDYSKLNLEAGDVITITNSVYGWTNQKFRILQMSENDDNNTIQISITAQIYDEDIYDTSDLYLYLREAQTGLIELDPLTDVSPITDSTAVVDSSGNSLLGLLGANGLLALIKLLTENNSSAPGGIYDKVFQVFTDVTGKDLQAAQVAYTVATSLTNTYTTAQVTAMAATSDPYNIYDTANQNDRTKWVAAPVANLPGGYDVFEVSVRTPSYVMNYWTKDDTGTIVNLLMRAQPAFDVFLLYGANLATATIVQNSTIDWTTNNSKISYQNPPAGVYWCALKLIPTYDLTLNWTRSGSAPNEIYPYNFVDQGPGTSDTVFTASAIVF